MTGNFAGHAEGEGEVSVSRGQAMLGGVQALDLFLFRDTHGAAAQEGDGLEDHGHGHEHPGCHHDHAQQLDE